MTQFTTSLVTYLRASTQQGAESIQRQRAILAAYAEQKDLSVSAEYVDQTNDATALALLLKDARLGKFSALLLDSPNRFGRDITNVGAIVEILKASKVSVIVVQPSYAEASASQHAVEIQTLQDLLSQNMGLNQEESDV